MPSSKEERLSLIYEVYRSALQRRGQDMEEAGADAQAKRRIRENVDNLEIAWLDAVTQSLAATGPAVEEAYEKAVAAKKAIDDALKAEKGLYERIGLVGDLVGKIGDLVSKASAA